MIVYIVCVVVLSAFIAVDQLGKSRQKKVPTPLPDSERVVQAGPETRELLASLTKKWPPNSHGC